MDDNVLLNIGRIIQRDSKATTYKLALLRGVIDIVQENSPFLSLADGRAYMPMGLMMGKWMAYYYPLMESPVPIPQIRGAARLAFDAQFRRVIAGYERSGGFSAFHQDLMGRGINEGMRGDFLGLCESLRNTIVNMPMKHIGRSLSERHHSLFSYHATKMEGPGQILDIEFLIRNYGTFSVPLDYYEAFRTLGMFMGGQDSILMKWAEFSVGASGRSLSMEHALGGILRSPVTNRQTDESRRLYKAILQREGSVRCVWTGKAMERYDVDHLIPFSAWRNNDLWNLLPSQARINNQKRERIPSPAMIEARKESILHYWDLVHEACAPRFMKELRLALIGNAASAGWRYEAIAQLKKACDNLISTRGYAAWDLP